MTFYDGDGPMPSGSAWPAEYRGHYVLRTSANEQHPPIVQDEYGNKCMDATKIYGGCYCYVSANFYGYDNQSKGVACGLNGVMFARDGEPFGAVKMCIRDRS